MNCKPGDLAIITGTNRTPETIGRIVEVIRPAVWGEIFTATSGKLFRVEPTRFSWVVKSSSPLPWRMSTGELYSFEVAVTGDCHLTPISGVPVTDEVTDDIKEPA
jgi:hypothetical protein